MTPQQVLESVLALKPATYRVLVRIPPLKEKTTGGLYMPQDTAALEHSATILAEVVALGPDAYRDEKRFPSGPSCQVGDWIIFRAYAGTMLRAQGVEYRLLNDDSVEGVALKPEEIERQ
jgi:co-chaperonin GroES (HSP10)